MSAFRAICRTPCPSPSDGICFLPFPKLPATPSSSGHWELPFTANNLTCPAKHLTLGRQALSKVCPLVFRNFSPLLSQCSGIFLLSCFHLRGFFHSLLTISTVWTSLLQNGRSQGQMTGTFLLGRMTGQVWLRSFAKLKTHQTAGNTSSEHCLLSELGFSEIP